MVDPLSVVTAYGFELSEEGIQFLQEMDPKSKQNPVDYLLNNHIKKYSKAILSNDLNSATTSLKGKFILQIVSINNIAAPSINQSSTFSPRMLRVRLTDGTTTVYALEYEPIPKLSLETPPGTKVMVINPEFRNGRILLRPDMIRVLGGIVPDLYELWKSQEEMAKRNRYRKALRNASLQPPKFISFADYVQQRHNSRVKKGSTETPKKMNVSETAGKAPEMNKLEDLDLSHISDLRKEALEGLDMNSLKEMGKWGVNKSQNAPAENRKEEKGVSQNNRGNEKRGGKQVSNSTQPARSQPTRTLSEASRSSSQPARSSSQPTRTLSEATRAQPARSSSQPTRTLSEATRSSSQPTRTLSEATRSSSLSTPTHSSSQPNETKQAKLIDITFNPSTHEILCMLQLGKSILTLPATTRLAAYFMACSDDGQSIKGIKEMIVGEDYLFGFCNENGQEKIASLKEDDLVIPPSDFSTPSTERRTSNSHPPPRAFFKRSVRGRGGRGRGTANSRGRQISRRGGNH